MAFLRRLLGQGETPDGDEEERSEADPAVAEESELEHELELLREDQARHDELTERQLRYAHYAWQPPAQGGERRADDKDEGTT
jgi:hypothetical protein